MHEQLHAQAVLPEARRAARPWIELLARAGYVAKGVLYLTIGVLATLLAVGDHDGKATDSHGALETLGRQPYGEALLVALAIGLAGHALWRFVQGTLDPEHEIRRSEHPLLSRASFLVRAFLHAGLVVFAVKTVMGERADHETAQSTSAQVMAWQPFGVWLVGLAGAVIIGFGLQQIHEAFTGKVGQELSMRRLSWSAQRLVVRFGRFGTAARGAVFALAGAFLVHAAIEANPRNAKGLGDILQWLRAQSFGDVVLLVAAVGLVAYGAYQLVIARYRAIRAC
jgi:hypothetical protein